MALKECRECGDQVSTEAEACPHCGAPDPVPGIERGECYSCGREIEIEEGGPCPHCDLPAPLEERPLVGGSGSSTKSKSQASDSEKSDGLAAFLGLVLGPVGLWYKGNWAAGFAWLIAGGAAVAVTYGIAAPFVWIGMAVHAYKADVQ